MEHSNLRSLIRIAGVVVLYKSPPSCIESIQTYCSQVEKLYVVDNSPVAVDWIDQLSTICQNVEYDHFSDNPGIATALNAASQKAIDAGFTHLLTMDDDSQAPPDMITQMLAYLSKANTAQIGILTPQHILTTATTDLSRTTTEPKAVSTAMTSGNLLSLTAYKQIGPFCDPLFIDVVDHEYNFRLRKYGFQIIELPTVQLTHRLGTQKKSLGFSFVSHTPLRNYYLVRNSIYVANLYRPIEPGYIIYAFKIVVIEAAKAALLEDKSLERLHYIWRGIQDGFRGRLGKLATT